LATTSARKRNSRPTPWSTGKRKTERQLGEEDAKRASSGPIRDAALAARASELATHKARRGFPQEGTSRQEGPVKRRSRRACEAKV